MFSFQYDGRVIRQAILLYTRIKSFRKVALLLDVGKSSVHRWYHSLHSHRIISTRRKRRFTRKPKFPGLIQELKELFLSDKLLFTTLQDIRYKLSCKPSLSCIRWALLTNRATLEWRRRCTQAALLPSRQALLAYKRGMPLQVVESKLSRKL